MTQAELAAKIGRPQAFISRLESGTTPPPRVDEAVAIGKALDVDPLTLVYGQAS